MLPYSSSELLRHTWRSGLKIFHFVSKLPKKDKEFQKQFFYNQFLKKKKKKEEKVPKFSVPDIRGISFLFFWKNLVQEYRLLRFFDLLLNVGQKIIESDFATVQMNVRKPSETHYMLENK